MSSSSVGAAKTQQNNVPVQNMGVKLGMQKLGLCIATKDIVLAVIEAQGCIDRPSCIIKYISHFQAIVDTYITFVYMCVCVQEWMLRSALARNAQK